MSHHFDAFAPFRPQALAFSIGPATSISGARRFALSLPKDHGKTLVLYQPGGGITQLYYWQQAVDGTWGGTASYNIDSTGIEANASASSPEKVMCTRGSVRLRNVSPAGEMAGAVHCLKLSSGAPGLNTSAYSELASLVLSHQRTHTTSGSQLSMTHQWDCVPVSQDKYHGFHSPIYGNGEAYDPGLTTILFVFEHSAAKEQTYEFSMAACYYARYAVTGPLSNAASLPPTCGIAQINRSRDFLERLGSLGRPIAATAASAFADRAMEAIPGMLGNLVNANRAFPALPP